MVEVVLIDYLADITVIIKVHHGAVHAIAEFPSLPAGFLPVVGAELAAGLLFFFDTEERDKTVAGELVEEAFPLLHLFLRHRNEPVEHEAALLEVHRQQVAGRVNHVTEDDDTHPFCRLGWDREELTALWQFTVTRPVRFALLTQYL